MSNLGKIIICATPIGNLSDASFRLIEELKNCDVIYAEDTRVTSKLLSHFKIKKPIKRLDENLMGKKANEIVDLAKSGSTICYCSDAGMPGVSDPGLKLVATARNRDVKIEVVPGPSAVLTAYVASGFTNQHFYFGGFFPRKESEIKKDLSSLLNLNAVLIFYESPNRLLFSLKVIAEINPEIRIAVCRELTKIHEEIVNGKASEVYKDFLKRDSIKGEIVVCIDSYGKTDNSADKYKVNSLAKKLTEEGLKTSVIADVLCEAFQISKNDAKKVALNAKK